MGRAEGCLSAERRVTNEELEEEGVEHDGEDAEGELEGERAEGVSRWSSSSDEALSRSMAVLVDL